MDVLQPQIDIGDDGEVNVSIGTETRDDIASVELLPLSGFLNIENPGARQSTQMKTIMDYFSEGSQGIGDVLHKVREAERRMGEVKLGESRLAKLYNYVQQRNVIRQAEEVIDSL